MKILVVGGTQMVGRDFIEYCLENGHEKDIHIANRGLTNPLLFKNLKHIKINRDTDIECSSLKQYYYDIIIDFSCYNTNQFYNVFKNCNFINYFILSTLTVLDTEALSNSNNLLHKYAWNKKLLEEYILLNNLPITIIRTGAMYGKNDYTNRFYEFNNDFYFKHNNQKIIESEYIIYVRNFTKYLYKHIMENNSNKNKILTINKNGATVSL